MQEPTTTKIYLTEVNFAFASIVNGYPFTVFRQTHLKNWRWVYLIFGALPQSPKKNKTRKEDLKMEKRHRPIQKKVRFSSDEIKYLENKISESPFTNFQNYARIALLTKKVVFVDYSELYHLSSEVHRIGNNINQLAKLANTFEDISKIDVQEMTSAIKELSQLIENKLQSEIRKESN